MLEGTVDAGLYTEDGHKMPEGLSGTGMRWSCFFLLFLLLALGEEEMSCARAGDGLNVPLQVTR